METAKTFQVPGLPETSTLDVNYGLRAVAGLTTLEVHDEPRGQAHRDLVGDIFLEMYTDEVSPKESVDGRELNQHLMDFMRGAETYNESLVGTRANLPSSMFTSSMMWLHLSRDEVIRQALKKQEQAESARQEAKQKQVMADAMQMAGEQSGDGELLSQAKKLTGEAKRLNGKADTLTHYAIETAKETTGSDFKKAGMSAALTEAKEQAQELAQAAAGWGLGRGSDIYSDPTAALKFLNSQQGFIKKLAKLAGRLRGFALQGRESRPVRRGLVPADVDTTRNITRVLPSELMRLHPAQPGPVRLEAISQLSDRGLLGMVPVGDKEELGPFVAAVDTSPSMRGERELVAKALSLGVGLTAKLDGRKYVLFDFASDPNTMYTVTSDDGMPEHIKWAGHKSRGGTDFDMALAHAMKLLNEMPGNGRNADLLFFSDGEATVSEETKKQWFAFQEQTDARLFYVPVGNSYYMDMEHLADRVYHLEEIRDDTGVNLAKELGAWLR